MKTTMKAKIVIETDKYADYGAELGPLPPLTLVKIQEEINKGHYIIEWISPHLTNEVEPTIIIKL